MFSSCITFEIIVWLVVVDDEDDDEAGECLNPSIQFILFKFYLLNLKLNQLHIYIYLY